MRPAEWTGVSRETFQRLALILVVVGSSFVLGYCVSRVQFSESRHQEKQSDPKTTSQGDKISSEQLDNVVKSEIWTCSMHPQIRLPHPGKCPICFMELIPIQSGSVPQAGGQPRIYSMTETAKRLAQVQTAEVTRQPAKVLVPMLGMVVEDETRAAALTSRVEGRLDEIYVNFTGVLVNQGDPMVKIWSPTLIKSQVELFETIRSSEPDQSVLKGAEEKLIQLGMTKEQVEELKAKKKPILYVTLKAPINGTVMKKFAVLGQFVKEGTEMYTINDLSHIWIKLDAYETDIPWIRYGQDVTFTTPAIPGKTFKGKVLFIDPMLDTKTRSVKIRVEAENPELSLKPGMFVSAELESEIDQLGKVIKTEWAGKYICPVHPRDEASSEPGVCPDSKMALKPAAAYGYSDEKNPVHPLVIPASAPLITGKRAIVYVEVPNSEQPTYEVRDVVLGPRAGDKYIVYDGLKEGEHVVTKGNFKIDSAIQIMGGASMMNPPSPTDQSLTASKTQEQEVVDKIDAPKDFLDSLSSPIKSYISLKDALVDEDVKDAGKFAKDLEESIKKIESKDLSRDAQATWEKLSGSLLDGLPPIYSTTELNRQREAFERVSETMVKLIMTFRHLMEKPLFVFHCSSASAGRGAYWIEDSQDKRNPYWEKTSLNTKENLKCGDLIDTIPPETFDKPNVTTDRQSRPSAQTEPGSENTFSDKTQVPDGTPHNEESHGDH
jgi:membrane fusion protein, copper/silver efflux system